jgi:hypothetical protein
MAAVARAEKCARCGKQINHRQIPSVWHQHVVCARCHCKLRALEPAMALSRSVRPQLPYANDPDAHGRKRHPGQMIRRCLEVVRHGFSNPQSNSPSLAPTRVVAGSRAR